MRRFMAKSLVTGGAGFIGSHIVDKLIDMEHDVIVIDNESANNEKFYWRPESRNYDIDIRDYQKTKDLYDGVDYVFHLAAESRIVPAIENPINAVSLNCVGTCTVLQCAREANVKKVIYSSTSSGYGRNPYPNTETQPDDCLNPYSVSKVAGEKICTMYTQLFGLKTIILRYFNVYGNRAPQKGQYAPVIGIFQRQRNAGTPLTIVGDGEQRRDFIHVDDVVHANLCAALSDIPLECYGQVYNVGSGINYSINEIADLISDNQIHISPRVGEARTTLCNNLKLKETFGWEPTINLIKWIEDNNL